MHHLLRAVGPVVGLVFLAAACGEDTPNSGAPGQTQPPGAGSEVTVVGENTSFDTTSFDATVGEELTITFDNRDDGVQHNFHVRDTADGDAMTEITEGPDTQTLTVTFDQPGEVEYLCDVHPDQMTGTITVQD